MMQPIPTKGSSHSECSMQGMSGACSRDMTVPKISEEEQEMFCGKCVRCWSIKELWPLDDQQHLGRIAVV